MMDFIELARAVVQIASEEPGAPIYIWLNFESGRDNWAVDSHREAMTERPTFICHPPHRLAVAHQAEIE